MHGLAEAEAERRTGRGCCCAVRWGVLSPLPPLPTLAPPPTLLPSPPGALPRAVPHLVQVLVVKVEHETKAAALANSTSEMLPRFLLRSRVSTIALICARVGHERRSSLVSSTFFFASW